MPFQSEAQRGFMYAKHPKIAKRFEAETPENAKLPEHVKKMNQGGMAGDWQNELADHMKQQYGNDPENPQHMFGGGTAGDFGVDLGRHFNSAWDDAINVVAPAAWATGYDIQS